MLSPSDQLICDAIDEDTHEDMWASSKPISFQLRLETTMPPVKKNASSLEFTSSVHDAAQQAVKKLTDRMVERALMFFSHGIIEQATLDKICRYGNDALRFTFEKGGVYCVVHVRESRKHARERAARNPVE